MKQREIKFRVWQPKWDSYAEYWKKYHPKMDYYYAINSDNIESTHISGINNETDVVFMQYIGVSDKNGREIYEGDIVKMTMPKGTIKEKLITVEYFIDNECGACGYLFPFSDGKIIEVIGNIFENPDLLTK